MKFKKINKEKLLFLFFITFVVALSFFVRANRASWGLPYLYHWDEPQTASNALQMLKTGDFNPHFFSYGTFIIYLNYIVDVLHYLYLMGQPAGVKPFLNHLTEIQTFWDSGWHWTISHPSFYYWNRIITAIFGTGAVVVTYLITKRLFNNKWIGLIAALFIGSANPHVETSALITPDIPTSFFILCTVLFSLKFIDECKFTDFIVALIFSGISIAIKYNSALVILLPFSALFIQLNLRNIHFPYSWILLSIPIPFITFLICMPYAFLDSVAFLNGIGSELRHYKVNGHGSQTSIPGLDHIKYQLMILQQNIGIFLLGICLIGTLAVLKNPKLIFVMLFPAFYFLYMTQMKVNFHRNFLIIYPFIAILYGASIWLIFYISKLYISKFHSKNYLPFALIFPLILIFPLLNTSFHAIDQSLQTGRLKDSRSEIIEPLNKLENIGPIYIASELRFHDEDLRKLKSHELKDLKDIFSCNVNNKDSIAVIPSALASVNNSLTDQEKIKTFNSNTKNLDANKMLLKAGVKNNALLLDIYSISPGIYAIPIKYIAKCG